MGVLNKPGEVVSSFPHESKAQIVAIFGSKNTRNFHATQNALKWRICTIMKRDLRKKANLLVIKA